MSKTAAAPAPVRARRSFIAADSVAVSPGKHGAQAPPAGAREVLQAAAAALSSAATEAERERALGLCGEAADALLEEGRRRAAGAGEAAEAAAEFSPREGGPEEGGDGSLERVEAAYILSAAALVAAEGRTHADRTTALTLAERAAQAHPCAMTRYGLAASAAAAAREADAPTRAAGEAAAAAGALRLLEEARGGGAPQQDEVPYLLRAAWLLARLGSPDAAAHADALARRHPHSYLALLLLSLLHSAAGDHRAALQVAAALQALQPADPAACVLGALCAVMVEPDAADAGERASAHLSRAVALLQAQEAALAAAPETRKQSLKAMCLHCAPGEAVVLSASSAAEERRRVAHGWVLVARAAAALECLDVADAAAEAGLAYVGGAQALYPRAFARLLCARARVLVLRALARGDGPAHVWRRRNLLGLLRLGRERTAGVPRAGVARLPLDTTLAAALTAAAPTAAAAAPPACPLLQQESALAAAYVHAALEAAPGEAEALYLAGVVALLEAHQPQGPPAPQGLALALHHLKGAMRAAPLSPDAYTAAGAAAEAMGADELAYDLYASGAEVAARAPCLPLECFAYVYE